MTNPGRPTPEALGIFKEKWIPVVKAALPRESWMDDDDSKFLLDAAIQEMGGWQAIYSAVQHGVQNGYTEDQQIQLLKIMLSPTPQ